MSFYEKYLKYKTKYLFSDSYSFVNNLFWRRAEKHFAPGEVNLENIDLAIINAPSSYGIQPYKVFKIINQDLKIKLKPACHNQDQITECHALYIFCAVKDYVKRIDEYVDQTGFEFKKKSMLKYISKLSDPTEWCKRQAYIALAFGISAAMEQRIASCPMEGFEPDLISNVLQLDNNLAPCVLLTVGKQTLNYKLEARFRFKDIIEELD